MNQNSQMKKGQGVVFSAIAAAAVQLLNLVRLFTTPWTIACQVPLSMGFPRQECWNRLPFPSPGFLPDPGIKLASPALVGGFFTTEPPGKPHFSSQNSFNRNNKLFWTPHTSHSSPGLREVHQYTLLTLFIHYPGPLFTGSLISSTAK